MSEESRSISPLLIMSSTLEASSEPKILWPSWPLFIVSSFCTRIFHDPVLLVAGAFIGAGVWSAGAFIGAGVWNCFSAIV